MTSYMTQGSLGTFCSFIHKPETAPNSTLPLDAKARGARTEVRGRACEALMGPEVLGPTLRDLNIPGGLLNSDLGILSSNPRNG